MFHVQCFHVEKTLGDVIRQTLFAHILYHLVTPFSDLILGINASDLIEFG